MTLHSPLRKSILSWCSKSWVAISSSYLEPLSHLLLDLYWRYRQPHWWPSHSWCFTVPSTAHWMATDSWIVTSSSRYWDWVAWSLHWKISGVLADVPTGSPLSESHCLWSSGALYPWTPVYPRYCHTFVSRCQWWRLDPSFLVFASGGIVAQNETHPTVPSSACSWRLNNLLGPCLEWWILFLWWLHQVSWQSLDSHETLWAPSIHAHQWLKSGSCCLYCRDHQAWVVALGS